MSASRFYKGSRVRADISVCYTKKGGLFFLLLTSFPRSTFFVCSPFRLFRTTSVYFEFVIGVKSRSNGTSCSTFCPLTKRGRRLTAVRNCPRSRALRSIRSRRTAVQTHLGSHPVHDRRSGRIRVVRKCKCSPARQWRAGNGRRFWRINYR